MAELCIWCGKNTTNIRRYKIVFDELLTSEVTSNTATVFTDYFKNKSSIVCEKGLPEVILATKRVTAKPLKLINVFMHAYKYG